jgi:hypothetical protein
MIQRRTYRLCFAGLAALWLAGQPALAQSLRVNTDPVVITLAHDVEIDDSIVELAQIAKFTGGQESLRNRLAKLYVVEFKLGVQQVTVAREQVRFRLLLAGLDERQFVLRGAARTFVRESDAPVTFRKIAHAAEQAVREQYTASVSAIVHRSLEVPTLAPRTGERCRLSARVKSAPERAGFALVDVALTLNGKTCAVVPVTVEIGDRPALPSLDSLERSAIRPALHTAPATAADEPFVVKARDNVKITARIGTARIEALGEALQDGRVGDVIRVRNTESGRTVHGRIEQGGLIIVDY